MRKSRNDWPAYKKQKTQNRKLLKALSVIFNSDNYSWAVMDGDVGPAAVPVPAVVWLFGSGLGLLGWFRCRQNA
jgi:hypothetical protein